MSNPSRLAVFDFDGTLFRSPWPPIGVDAVEWYGDVVSLLPPFVELFPPLSRWNVDVVEQALICQDDPDCLPILLTGRLYSPDLFGRISELLAQRELKFRFLGLNSGSPTHEGIMDFKIGAMNECLNRFPSIQTIEMWEDEDLKAQTYDKVLQNSSLNGRVHKVG